MPYIAVSQNKYIGEHNCKNYHYGDMTLIRDCCVNDAKKYKQMTLENALTKSHPAYIMFISAYDNLTDSERLLVGDIVADGYNNGFKELPITSFENL
jgi:hypothetical protein